MTRTTRYHEFMRIFWIAILSAGFSFAQPKRGSPQVNYEKPDFKPPPSVGPSRGDQGIGGSLIAVSYQAKDGEFLLDFGFGHNAADSTIDRAGRNYTTGDKTEQSVSLGLTYGIADYLSLGILTRYYLKDSNSTTYGPASLSNGAITETEADGFDDPTFSSQVRLTGQTNYYVNLDLVVQVKPGLMPAQYGTSTKKGSKGQGGFTTVFGGYLSREFGMFGLGGKALYYYQDLRAKTDPDGRNKSEYSGGNSLVLGVDGLIKPIDQLGIKVGLDYYSVSPEEIRIVSTNTFSSIGAYSFIALNFSAQVEIMPGSLLLEGFYKRTLDQKATYSSSNVDYDITVSQSTFGVGLRSAF